SCVFAECAEVRLHAERHEAFGVARRKELYLVHVELLADDFEIRTNAADVLGVDVDVSRLEWLAHFELARGAHLQTKRGNVAPVAHLAGELCVVCFGRAWVVAKVNARPDG